MVVNVHQVNNFIHLTEEAINTARTDPEIAAALAEFGYTREKLQNGVTFLAGAKIYFSEFTSSNGMQSLKMKELLAVWETADHVFSIHRQLAKIALKHTPTLTELLGLTGPKYRSLSGWLLQARQFYTNALLSTDAQIALARFNLNRKKLEEGQVLIRQVAELENAISEMGDDPYEVLKMDGALDNLVNWFDDFVDISKIALEKTPHLLKKLGVVQTL